MKKPKPLHVAIDGAGNPLQFTPGQVEHVVKMLSTEGEVLLVIFRKGDDLGVLVLGDPNPAIPDILETTARSYRKALALGPQEGS